MKKTLEKLLVSFLVAAMVLTCAPLSGIADFDWASLFVTKASAAELAPTGRCGENVYWTFDESAGLFTISGTGAMTDYYLYSNSPFYGNSSIKTVIINNGVTSIGDYAFKDCTGLTSITIPDSVTSVGEEAFYYTGYYNNSANWNNDVLYIGNYLIDAKDTIKGEYIIKDGTKVLADNAFNCCKGLASITIPDSVTSIGDLAFQDCTGLRSVTIGNSVTSIGRDAFEECTGLTSITIPNSVTSIDSGAFEYCTGLISVTIGNSVTSIGVRAFADCTGLTSITIPNSVTSIGDVAFGNCTGLTSITIPNSVTSIGSHAFSHCSNLTSVTIPNSITSIGELAFWDCAGLTSITVDKDNNVYDSRNNCNAIIEKATDTLIYGCKNTVIPDSVMSIGDEAFYYCTGLTSITIPNSVTSIGDEAFYYCTGLTSITIPNSVTSIGNEAFYKCTKLTSITIPDSVTSIGSGAFEYCTGLTSITIPNSVTSIGSVTFGGCESLTSITIPDSVTSIDDWAFSNCTGLTSITIPDSVTSIGNEAFYKCTKLTSITIPDSVTSIGDCAFEECIGLTSVTIGNSVMSIGWMAFYYTGYYNNSANWNNDVLYIGNYLIDAKDTIKGEYIIKDGTKVIADRAFDDCTGLTGITIPDSVTSIGVCAFENTEFSNNSAYYDNDVLYTGHYLIAAKGTIKGEYKINDGTKVIADCAFDYCTGLTGITIPESVTSIGKRAFEGCTVLNDVYYIGTEEQWKQIQLGEGNECLTNAVIHFCFEPINYTIKFFDGSALLGSKSMKYDEEGTLSYGSVPVKDGYRFIGWSTVKGGPALFSDGQSIKNLAETDGAVVSYYAVWEKAEEDEDRVITDRNTGIEIDIPSGTYSDDVTLKVEEIQSGSAFDVVENQVDVLKSRVFSIDTYVNGVKTQPDGFVTVKIPVPSGFNAEKCKLYYVNMDKEIVEEISIRIENGYIIFNTNHFSNWAVVEIKGMVKSVSLGNNISMDYKSSAKLNPVIDADSGVKYTVEYKSSNTNIATVDSNGNVYGAKKWGKGTATITCTVTDEYGNVVTDTCNVTCGYAWWQWIIGIVLFGWIWY